jgi:hypothetical protein
MKLETVVAAFLPKPEVLLRRSRAAGLLDAVLMPQWHLRYYSFDPHWKQGQWFAGMKDGSGEEYYVLNGRGFALIKGFVKASKFAGIGAEHGRPIEGLLPVQMPSLKPALREPALDWQYTTYVGWCTGDEWVVRCHSGEMGLCKAQCLVLQDDGRAYHRWAEEYYERGLDRAVVEEVFRSGLVTRSHVSALSPTGIPADLKKELTAMQGPLL